MGFSTWEHLVKEFLQVGGARKGYLRRTSVKAVSTLDLRYVGPNLGLMLSRACSHPPLEGVPRKGPHLEPVPLHKPWYGTWNAGISCLNVLRPPLGHALPPYAHHEILDVGRWLVERWMQVELRPVG